MIYRSSVWFIWKKRDVFLRAKGSRKEKISFRVFYTWNTWFYFLFFFIFKGNHHDMAAWRLDGLSSLSPCCFRQTSRITSVFFCCVYVNGTFKEKECFYVLQYFCGRHFITVSWKLGSFTSHQHIVFSFLSSSSLEPCGSECGVNATKES